MTDGDSNLIDSGTPLAEVVLRELLQGISRGEHKPGDRIVASSLCKKLGLSLAPVREALHLLHARGVVELHRNRGATLRTMSHQDVIDFTEIVGISAAVAIEMATKRIHLDDHQNLIKLEMQKVKENTKGSVGLEFYWATNEFHWTINKIARNPFIETLINRDLISYWEMFLTPMQDYVEDYVSSYQRLTDAIIVGDSRTARSIWEYHVSWVIAILKKEHTTPGAPWIR